MQRLGAILIVTASSSILIACNLANNNTAKLAQMAASPAVKSSSLLQPGQSAKVDNVTVTFNGARIVPPSQFDQPKEGMQIVATDFNVQNTANQPYTLSTLLSLAMLDKDKRKYSVTIASNLNGTIEGTIPANGSVRGEAAFEVPADGAPYTVQFTQPVGNQSASWMVPLP